MRKKNMLKNASKNSEKFSNARTTQKHVPRTATGARSKKFPFKIKVIQILMVPMKF